MAENEPCSIRLASPIDVDGFRRVARHLVAQGVVPERVSWQAAGAAEAPLFEADDDGDAMPPSPPLNVPPFFVPPFFVPLCERVALHADTGRFGLLYRLLWRLLHEPALRADPLDADRILAEQMARAVHREMHKMTAFVRFRRVAEAANGEAWHVAWFEPRHHIVEATAPFFARRFAQMRWAILTPGRSVRWDGETLAFGPGARRDEAPPADAGEQLWLTYYEHIFNPARLKLAMMRREMPRRYWHNLPEAVLIQPLAAQAEQRTAAMMAQAASEPSHRRSMAATRRRLEIHADVAAAPGTLAALRRATEHCRECPLGALATQAVNGEGPADARLMLVGEQPGDQEDLRGRPFVGPAGKLLDRALQQLGWPRDALYLTNALKHFKYELRGKRRIHKTPAQREAAACLHWLEAEIELVKPQALIALGATAARALMGTAISVTRERGHWLERSDGLPVLISLHPSALLRMEPNAKEDAYEQWLADLAQAARYAKPG